MAGDKRLVKLKRELEAIHWDMVGSVEIRDGEKMAYSQHSVTLITASFTL